MLEKCRPSCDLNVIWILYVRIVNSSVGLYTTRCVYIIRPQLLVLLKLKGYILVYHCKHACVRFNVSCFFAPWYPQWAHLISMGDKFRHHIFSIQELTRGEEGGEEGGEATESWGDRIVFITCWKNREHEVKWTPQENITERRQRGGVLLSVRWIVQFQPLERKLDAMPVVSQVVTSPVVQKEGIDMCITIVNPTVTRAWLVPTLSLPL